MYDLTIEQFAALPLSEQILLACEDHRALAADPASPVTFNMHTWVRPEADGKCAVCFAGGTLFRRFGLRSTAWSLLPRFAHRLNDVREGQLPRDPIYDAARKDFREIVNPPTEDDYQEAVDPDDMTYEHYLEGWMAPVERYEEAARYLKEHGL